MAVFDVSERKDVMDGIVSFAMESEHIAALIAVGSGAFGYTDELSDLDMVIATDSDEAVAPVMDEVAAQLRKRLNLIYFKQAPERRLQVFLTDRYLEIDIGYGCYKRAAAIRPHWRVIFDKTGTVDEAMRRSWEAREAAPKDGAREKKADECADMAWFHFMHAAVAIRRGRYWRAVAEMEAARNLYIGLLGCRYSLDTDRNKDTDQLPDAERAALQSTLVSALTREALWRGLTALADATYAELERCGERTQIPVDRRQLEEYLRFCRNP